MIIFICMDEVSPITKLSKAAIDRNERLAKYGWTVLKKDDLSEETLQLLTAYYDSVNSDFSIKIKTAFLKWKEGYQCYIYIQTIRIYNYILAEYNNSYNIIQ